MQEGNCDASAIYVLYSPTGKFNVLFESVYVSRSKANIKVLAWVCVFFVSLLYLYIIYYIKFNRICRTYFLTTIGRQKRKQELKEIQLKQAETFIIDKLQITVIYNDI